MRNETDDLSEIRQLIKKTRENIETHVNTVDLLKIRLLNISRRSAQTLEGGNS